MTNGERTLNKNVIKCKTAYISGRIVNSLLTEYQNRMVTDVLCKLALDRFDEDEIKPIREMLIRELSEVNRASAGVSTTQNNAQ